MSNCPITYGYTIPCKPTAGVKEVYIGTYDSGLLYTIDSSAPGVTSSYGTITGFTGSVSNYKKFEVNDESASYTSTGAFTMDSAFYTGVLELTLVGLDQATIELIMILGKGRWRVVILDQEDKYWLMGKNNPVNVTGATPGLGKAFGDTYGAVMTFTVKGKEPMVQVSSAAVSALGI